LGQFDELASFQAQTEGRYRVPLALSGFHPGLTKEGYSIYLQV
jgi:hypothetical protein